MSGRSRNGAPRTGSRGRRLTEKVKQGVRDVLYTDVPSFSLGGRWGRADLGEDPDSVIGSNMQNEVYYYGVYLFFWIGIIATSIGIVATAKHYQEVYLKKIKSDINPHGLKPTSQQAKMFWAANYIWIVQLVFGIVFGGFYVIATLVAVFQRTRQKERIFERNDLKNLKFQGRSSKVLFLECFYCFFVFLSFLICGSVIAAYGWRASTDKNHRGEMYPMHCTPQTNELCNQVESMGYACIAGMIPSFLALAIIYRLYRLRKRAADMLADEDEEGGHAEKGEPDESDDDEPEPYYDQNEARAARTYRGGSRRRGGPRGRGGRGARGRGRGRGGNRSPSPMPRRPPEAYYWEGSRPARSQSRRREYGSEDEEDYRGRRTRRRDDYPD